MSRVWLVAQREFLAAVMNKGFVIGLLVMPAIVSVLVMVIPRLISTQGTQIRGEVAVIDPTGQILEGLREGLSPEAISRRRAENARRALENTPAPVREVAGSYSDAAIERAYGVELRRLLRDRRAQSLAEDFASRTGSRFAFCSCRVAQRTLPGV